MFLREGMYHDAIVKVQQIIRHCQVQKMKDYELHITLLGIQARLHLGLDIT